MRTYRVVWSLLVARIQESGSLDIPLSAEDSLKARARDRNFEALVQSERDPYYPHDHKVWAQKRRRVA